MLMKPDSGLGLFQREIYTPARLAAKIQESFDRDFGHIWVEGEISELSLPHSGHAYFSLKDREARIKAVMWKGRRAYAGGALTEGLSVLVKGRLTVYAPRGDFQLVADYLEPRGEGALRLAFEKMKAKLEAEGLFNEDRKRVLPFWPSRVAVVSSPSGAAVRDFIQTALARRPGAAISLYPVRVQGAGAAQEIAEAIEDLNAWGGFDLIVLTRGGGSLEDLWAFNEEPVVRAVAASRIVTLAAVGHSTDLSLAELAADSRAITPTAAAEAVFRDQTALESHLEDQAGLLERFVYHRLNESGLRRQELEGRLTRAVKGRLTADSLRLDSLTSRLGRFEDRLGLTGQRLDELESRLARSVLALLDDRAGKLVARCESLRLLSPALLLNERQRRSEELFSRLIRGFEARLEAAGLKLGVLETALASLSPQAVLERGYALVTRPDGEMIFNSADLDVGGEVLVKLAKGGFKSRVEEVL